MSLQCSADKCVSHIYFERERKSLFWTLKVKKKNVKKAGKHDKEEERSKKRLQVF